MTIDQPMIGQTVSHYRIVEELGRGGMGVVYKAHDTKLDRTVALKFLSSEQFSSEEDRARLLREARSTAAVHHPNICSIIDVQEFESREFLVMEFIEGQSLRTLIDLAPLEFTGAIKIALQIAGGLKAAHEKGIIHGDIKPENILITGDGTVKIADFGLARRIGQLISPESNTVSGTVAYMSPEQLQGQPFDRSTDIWSLGIVLYEMVGGAKPFAGEYIEALMYEITNGKHRPVSALRNGVPKPLEKLIDRCLEKIPAVRFADVNMLIDELHRTELAMKNPRDSEAKSIAVLPFADISPDKDNEYFSDGLTEEIIANLSKLQMVKVVSRTSVMQYERREKTTRQIATDLDVQYILEGSVRKQGSDLRITAQLIDASQDTSMWAEKYRGTMDDIFDIQETVAAKIVKALKVRLTPGEKKNLKRRSTENTEAYQLYLKGRFFWNKRSEEGLLNAIRYFEEAIGRDARYAQAWAGIADAYNLLSEYRGISRKETYAKARSAVQKALEFDDRLAEAHTSLAFLIMLNELDWENSEKEFKHAISLNPRYATARHWYAHWLVYQGRTAEAVQEISAAAELDPFSPAILKDKGMVLYYSRDYDGAIEFANKALEFDSTFASAHRLLSLAYQGKGMFAEAIAENRRWGVDARDEVEASIALAQTYAAEGRRAEALRQLDQVNLEKLSSGNKFRGIALVYASLEENELAFSWFEKSYNFRAESLCALKVDPKLDKLRSDPRFNVLLMKIGLEG
ncbi:MAG TPA: protein kinase [Bacteroidota bacterium]|nr:protein kinase [Bacteroidota bacterium]